MLKKFALLIFSIICITCSGCIQKESEVKDDFALIQQRGELIVGVKTDTKPFGYYDENGNLKGFDIDLAKIIAKGLLGNENKIRFVSVTPSNRIIKLDSKEVDMLIATMSITEKRRLIVNFSSPYYYTGQALMVNKNSDITSLKNLAGKRVIIVFGSTSEKNVRATIPNAVIIGFKTYPEAFNALKNNLGDAMIADDTILRGFAMSDKSVKLIPKKYSQEPYAVAFRKTEDSAILENKVDIIIKNLISSRQLEKLEQKWGLE